jgi:cytochrome c oxidase assembly protein subunit 15
MVSIRRWVLATFILTFLTIIAGGVVRTTQSGMGCPDWPTCFGRWIPPTNASQLPPDFEKYLHKQDIDHTFNVFHTWTEYINRLVGELLGVFALIQFVLLYRKRKEASQAYKLAAAYLIAVILTGLFGGAVVLLNLAHLSITVHLLAAIILLQIELALMLSLQSKLSVIRVDDKHRKLFFFLLTVLFIQSALGTGVRMYVDGVSKTLHYEQRETWLATTPISFLIHRSFSWIVLLTTIFTTWYSRNITVIRNKLVALSVIIIMSMITGIVLFYADMPAIAQPIHLFLASCAITLTVSVILQTNSRQNEQRYPDNN